MILRPVAGLAERPRPTRKSSPEAGAVSLPNDRSEYAYRSSPSIVPADRLDRDIYLVLEDFGACAGCAWRETDEPDTDLETVLRDMLSGQYVYPLRIVCFNAIEGCSRDANSDIADALAGAWPTQMPRSRRRCRRSSRPTAQSRST